MLRSVQVVKSFVGNSLRNICQKFSQVKQLVVSKLDQVASFLFNALEQDVEKLYDLYIGVLVLCGTLVFSLTFSGEIVEPIFWIIFSCFLLFMIKNTEKRTILNKKFKVEEVIKWFSSMVISTLVIVLFVLLGIDIGCETPIEYAFRIYSTAMATHCIIVVVGLVALFVKGVWLNHFIKFLSFILQTLLTTNPLEKVVAFIYVLVFVFFFMGKFAFSHGSVIQDIKIDIQQNNPHFYSFISKTQQFISNLWQKISASFTRCLRQIIS